MKRCSISLAIREIYTKTKMRCHFTPPRMALIKKRIIIVEKDVEKLELSSIAGRIIKWSGCFGKQSGSKCSTQSCPMTQQFHS